MNIPSSSTPLLPSREICAALTISRSTLNNLRREGAPHVMVGDVARFSLPALLEWLKSRPRKPGRAGPGRGRKKPTAPTSAVSSNTEAAIER